MKVVHRSGSKAKKQKVTRSDYDYNAQKEASQKEVDAILDKISKSGYDSLSAKEKNILFNASNKK